MDDDAGPFFDVIATDLLSKAKRILATRKTERDAEAVINMAVARRGVRFEFFSSVPHPCGIKENAS